MEDGRSIFDLPSSIFDLQMHLVTLSSCHLVTLSRKRVRMNGFILRMIVALLFAAYLWAQARAVRDRPHRRRAFELAAGALLAFAAFNGMLAAGATVGPIELLFAAVGLGLFVASVVSVVLSLRGGEMRDQSDQIAAAAREYRARRTGEREPPDDEK